MTEIHPDYLKTLQLYYEEEIEGDAYFAALSDAFDHPDHREKLTLLAEVERFAASAVKPLIEKYALSPRAPSTLVESGENDAARTHADWPALMREMRQTYPGYLQAFRDLETIGPQEDQALLSLFSEHEVAALAFLALEDSAPAQSAEPLRAYLQIDPATWVASAS